MGLTSLAGMALGFPPMAMVSSRSGGMNDTAAGWETGADPAAGLTRVPAKLLEAFIPGYSLFATFVNDALGIDITTVVSVCFICFAASKALGYMWQTVMNAFWQSFSACVTIPSDDVIYDHMMKWLAEQQMVKKSRQLQVSTVNDRAWESDDDSDADSYDSDSDSDCSDSGDESAGEETRKAQEEMKLASLLEEGNEDGFEIPGLIDFRNWRANVPPRYEPSQGEHWFWHRGRIFLLSRERRSLVSQWRTMMTDQEDLRLTCVGRSTEPIKALLVEAKEQFKHKERNMTVVRRPVDKMQRSSSSRSSWVRVATRPSRPMSTVVLDHKQKQDLLRDVNEYLHPSTARWYANRGIPYRRGYLFHGPPGTGKSSLSFALAGIFGLDIYVVSLLEPTLTEEDLGMLMNHLPRRCVVLLEDIDSAGIKRQPTPAREVSVPVASPPANEMVGGSIDPPAPQRTTGGISLSGLLNAIDGVASHEGRVLVMTTNFPDELDAALIRPGRIDMQIGFSLADAKQIRELFVRMYRGTASRTSGASSPRKASEASKAGGPGRASRASETNKSSKKRESEKPEKTLQANGTPTATPNGNLKQTNGDSLPNGTTSPPRRTLDQLATTFSHVVPADKLTPAQIQGYLLTRKNDPEGAADQAEKWVGGVLRGD